MLLMNNVYARRAVVLPCSRSAASDLLIRLVIGRAQTRRGASERVKWQILDRQCESDTLSVCARTGSCSRGHVSPPSAGVGCNLSLLPSSGRCLKTQEENFAFCLACMELQGYMACTRGCAQYTGWVHGVACDHVSLYVPASPNGA